MGWIRAGADRILNKGPAGTRELCPLRGKKEARWLLPAGESGRLSDRMLMGRGFVLYPKSSGEAYQWGANRSGFVF